MCFKRKGAKIVSVLINALGYFAGAMLLRELIKRVILYMIFFIKRMRMLRLNSNDWSFPDKWLAVKIASRSTAESFIAWRVL